MRLILSIFILSLALSAQAQTYTIIHSIGKIYESKSGKYLSKGMRIDESAQLKFETPGAKAAVLSSKRGRFVIQKQAASGSQSEISYALSSVLSPARGRLSTRAGGINNKLDFQKKFGEGPVAIVGDKLKVAVSPSAYPMNDNKFFYASYSYNGEPINKKLSNDGDSLIFETATFYAVDDNPIDPAETSDTKLFYYNADSQESTMVTSLDFSVVSYEDLKSMIDQMSDIDLEERNQAVLEIINSILGKCSEKDLNNALAKI